MLVMVMVKTKWKTNDTSLYGAGINGDGGSVGTMRLVVVLYGRQ